MGGAFVCEEKEGGGGGAVEGACVAEEAGGRRGRDEVAETVTWEELCEGEEVCGIRDRFSDCSTESANNSDGSGSDVVVGVDEPVEQEVPLP